MTKNTPFTYFIFAFVLILCQSCKKEKQAENALEGTWLVNSNKSETIVDYHPLVDSGCIVVTAAPNEFKIVFSGELFLNDDGNGYMKIYEKVCDSTFLLFDMIIEKFRIEKHESSYSHWEGRVHSYQGYFNDTINFSCTSSLDDKPIRKNTSEIKLSFVMLVDRRTLTGYIEHYHLNLFFKRQ